MKGRVKLVLWSMAISPVLLLGCTGGGVVDDDGSFGSREQSAFSVEIVGERVRDTFCTAARFCWPLVNPGMVGPGLIRAAGELTLEGFSVSMTGPAYDTEDRVVDSNSTENDLQQWISSRRPLLPVWQTEGAGEGRARVWFPVADEDLVSEIATEFGDQVDVDADTLIFDGSRVEYEALHDLIGVLVEVEPRLECAGVTVDIEPSQIGRAKPPEAGCHLSAFDHNDARIALAAAPQPGEKELTLIFQERACASGRTPDPEDIVVLLDESAERVAVGVLLIQPSVSGGTVQTCPGNPTIEVDINLDEPVTLPTTRRPQSYD
jgi:hypothetical protein